MKITKEPSWGKSTHFNLYWAIVGRYDVYGYIERENMSSGFLKGRNKLKNELVFKIYVL